MFTPSSSGTASTAGARFAPLEKAIIQIAGQLLERSRQQILTERKVSEVSEDAISWLVDHGAMTQNWVRVRCVPPSLAGLSYRSQKQFSKMQVVRRACHAY